MRKGRVAEPVGVLVRKCGNHTKKIARYKHIVDGIERFPEALRMLFDGQNNGKLLLRP